MARERDFINKLSAGLRRLLPNSILHTINAFGKLGYLPTLRSISPQLKSSSI
jgi:hypothetical protein